MSSPKPARVPENVSASRTGSSSTARFTPREQKRSGCRQRCARIRDRHCHRDHGVGRRRSTDLAARRQGPARAGRTRVHIATGLAHRAAQRCRARGDHQIIGHLRPLRADGRSRVRVRKAQKPRRGENRSGRSRRHGRDGRTPACVRRRTVRHAKRSAACKTPSRCSHTHAYSTRRRSRRARGLAGRMKSFVSASQHLGGGRRRCAAQFGAPRPALGALWS